MRPGYMYLWEYRVAPTTRADFVGAYGPAGDWVQLFASAPGYVRTELHCDRSDPTRLITIDYWESESAWQAFRAESVESFDALDARCAALTTHETELGRFEPAGA